MLLTKLTTNVLAGLKNFPAFQFLKNNFVTYDRDTTD